MSDLKSTTWRNTIQDSVATAATTTSAAALAPELLRLQHLIQQGTGAISTVPRQIKMIVTKHSSKFVGNSQEDAHEFFLDLINLLHEELHSMRSSLLKHWTPPLRDRCEKDDDDEEAKKNEQERQMFESLPTTRNLHAEVQVSLQCKGCNKTHQGKELYRDISADLPVVDDPSNGGPPIKVTSLMSNFFQPEERELTCEECGHKKFLVSYSLDVLPRVLVIHMKRFQYNSKFVRYIKCHTPVVMEPIIDVGKFCTANATNVPMHDLGPPSVVPLPAGPSSISSTTTSTSTSTTSFSSSSSSAVVPISPNESPATPVMLTRPEAKKWSGSSTTSSLSSSKRSVSKRELSILESKRDREHEKRKREETTWGSTKSPAEKPLKARKILLDQSSTTSNSNSTSTSNDNQRKGNERVEDKELAQALEASRREFSSQKKLEKDELEKDEALFLIEMEKAKKESIAPNFTQPNSMNTPIADTVIDITSPSDQSQSSQEGESRSMEAVDSTSTNSTSTSSVQFVSKDTPLASTKYRLQCVVRHSGKNAFAGHYTTDVRQKNGSWSRYDDARVQNALSLKDVVSGDVNQKEGYVLYYTQVVESSSDLEKEEKNVVLDLT